jgi:hypothetical protein
MTRGLVVVGAMSSLKRKAGYSSWGRHLTVTAPSNNMHYITSFIDRGVNDAVRDLFVANYRGLGQVAAANRPGVATPFRPLQDDPSTPDFAENFYTVSFGGTSGAAPVVTGVVALMLSVNPTLTARQVRQILMATADQDLDPTLDLSNDPNAQGLSGAFVNGRSLFFGSGKINAARAVERARALLGPSIMSEQLAAPTPTSDTYDVTSYATSADRFAALLNTAETIASMSVAATTTEAPLSPTPNQCVAWRLGSFRRRVLVAVAQWAQEPASSILPSNTLGELAKGTSWNEGQQARLVQSVNANDVYFPFPNTRMAPPPQLVPSSTTVAQWEEIVWRQQSPRTDCFFKVG